MYGKFFFMKKSKESEDPGSHPTLNRATTPEQLQKMVKVVGGTSWLMLGGFATLLLAALFWLIFASIPIEVQGRGLVMSPTGVFVVRSQSEGQLRELLVKPGQKVISGETLAVVEMPEWETRLREIEDKVIFLESDTERLRNLIKQEREDQVEELKREMIAQEFKSDLLREDVKILTTEFEAKSKLHHEGVITSNILNSAKQLLDKSKTDLENVELELVSLHTEIHRGHRNQELKIKEQQLHTARSERDLIRLKEMQATVRTVSAGTVLGFMHSPGDAIDVGSPLVWLERSPKQGESYLFYAYLPIEKGRKLQVGTRVQIEISNVNKDEYGTLLGVVQEVSKYGTSKENVTTFIHNKELVDFLTEGQTTLVQVVVKPQLDLDTLSGYSWSLGEGPPYEITSGSVGVMRAVVERVSPIYYLFPSKKLTRNVRPISV